MTSVIWQDEARIPPLLAVGVSIILPYRYAPGGPRRAHSLQGLVQLRQIDLGDGLQFGQRGFEFFRSDAVLLLLGLCRTQRGEVDELNDRGDRLVGRRRRDVYKLAASRNGLRP